MRRERCGKAKDARVAGRHACKDTAVLSNDDVACRRTLVPGGEERRLEALDGARTNAFGEPTVTLHLHDTFGHAADCVREALTMGIRSFDGSASGLGGCPYASTDGARAPGNIATELLISTIAESGETTSLNPAKLAHAGTLAERIATAAQMRAAADGQPAQGDSA